MCFDDDQSIIFEYIAVDDRIKLEQKSWACSQRYQWWESQKICLRIRWRKRRFGWEIQRLATGFLRLILARLMLQTSETNSSLRNTSSKPIPCLYWVSKEGNDSYSIVQSACFPLSYIINQIKFALSSWLSFSFSYTIGLVILNQLNQKSPSSQSLFSNICCSNMYSTQIAPPFFTDINQEHAT